MPKFSQWGKTGTQEGVFVGLGEQDFSQGIASVRGLMVKERAQIDARHEWRMKWLAAKTEEAERAVGPAPVVDEGGPLWQRVCGFTPKNEVSLEPGERRAGIRRLLRVVETMVRAELKTADIDRDGEPARLAMGAASFAGRSTVWEPLHEICFYLGISKAKLDALSVQRTGLRAVDICDCIRAENVRGTLRDVFRTLVRAWMELQKKGGESVSADDRQNAAWRFVKWVRGGGRGETRKKLAFEMGIASRERLDRAVMIGERKTIETVEIEEAVKAIEEATDAGVSAHGAGCDEVGRERATAAMEPEATPIKEGEARAHEELACQTSETNEE